ncbi:MAG: hypothetical protein M1812_003282 [Candelaria pacifica]|nr:MAG: hypothetical protein M1812_003282 [Candelaria pacifica]
MSSTTVHVKNISPETSEKEVRDFFSFCGKITSLSVTPASDASDSPQSATVNFEKATAAKTALLLDSTQLGSSEVQVSSAANLDDIAPSKGTTSEDSSKDGQDIAQEDKPRSRIVAEYLAHGYTISDKAIQNAISLDSKHGVSTRFTTALSNFDSKYKVSDKAKSVDANYGITNKAYSGWQGLNSYFEKAAGTPTGQRVRQFYTQTDRQVRDIHTEARRLADIKGGKESNEIESVGDGKTVCNCGSDLGKCPCEPGKCACSSCPKNSADKGEKSEKSGGHTATGASDEIAASAGTAPLGETIGAKQ